MILSNLVGEVEIVVSFGYGLGMPSMLGGCYREAKPILDREGNCFSLMRAKISSVSAFSLSLIKSLCFSW